MADPILIIPRDLPPATEVFAFDALVVDDGTIVAKATPQLIVNAGAPVASQAEAIAGADNTKRMTPLRTKQVLDNVTAPSVLRAQAWAEASGTPDPGIPGSQSAKSWAAEAKSTAEIMEKASQQDQYSLTLSADQTVIDEDADGNPIIVTDVADVYVDGFLLSPGVDYEINSDGHPVLLKEWDAGKVVRVNLIPNYSSPTSKATETPPSASLRSFAAEPYDSVAAVLASKQITAALVGSTIFTKTGDAVKVVDSDYDFLHPVTGAGIKAITLSPEVFGAKGDGTTDDSAAFRAFWLAARKRFFVDGDLPQLQLRGRYYLKTPVADHSLAILVWDFGGCIDATPGTRIMFDGSHTGWMMQVGTYATQANRRYVDGILVLQSVSETHKGLCLADMFQSTSFVRRIQTENATDGITVINNQEVTTELKSSGAGTAGLRIQNGASVQRVSGSNNSYTTGSGMAATTNSEYHITVQSPKEDGVVLDGSGNSVKLSGVIQGAGATDKWLLKLNNGSGIHLDNLYLESSNSIHNELMTGTGYTGTLLVTGSHGSTIGSRAVFSGGNISWFGNDWQGVVRSDDVATFRGIMDFPPASGFQNGAQNRFVILNDFRKVVNYQDPHAGTNPQNNIRFYQGELAPGATLTFFSGGNAEASGDARKGFEATVRVLDTATGNMCTAIYYVNGKGTYPATTSATEEKLGTLAAANATLSSTRAGSTPYHILYGRLQYAAEGTGKLHYSVEVRPWVL